MEHWGLPGGTAISTEADGSIRLGDGRLFRRSPQRVTRSNGRLAVEAGSPVVTGIYPDGTYLFENEAAAHAWQQILPRLVIGKPPPVRDLQWIGHIFAADDGSQLLFFDGSH